MGEAKTAEPTGGEISNRDIVVVGASMGGMEALKKFVANLPGMLQASIFIVQHVAPSAPGIFARILDQAGPLPASNPLSGEKFRPGHIYVAPPDHHLLLETPGLMRVTRGPKENRSRPSVDALFRSAAYAFGPRVIGIVLTGYLDDGTAGLWAIKDRGGVTVVQDPTEAEASSMPLSALEHVAIDHCLSLQEMPALLTKLTNNQVEQKGDEPPELMKTEVDIAKDNIAGRPIEKLGNPSIFACPECHGVLKELREGKLVRFRCHTGHAYSLDALLSEYWEKIDESLWNSIRGMQELAMLLERMGSQAAELRHVEASETLRLKAVELQRRAEMIRSMATTGEQPVHAEDLGR